MAERRMISKKIVDTDLFLDMSPTARLLYYDLLIRADDDGFVGNPKKITRMVGASDDDLKTLVMKRFIFPFESGICVIKDWRIHNYIKTDRYQPTQYVEEKSQLHIESNKSYEMNGTEMEPECIQSGTKMDTQVRLELGKDSIGKNRDRGVGEETPDKPAGDSLYEQVRNSFVSNCPSLPEPIAVAKWTSGRKKAVRDKKLTVDEFTEVFKRIEQSDFLTGRDDKWHGCSFDWILKPANWQKINEGNYDNRGLKKPDHEPSYDIEEFLKSGAFESFDSLKR